MEVHLIRYRMNSCQVCWRTTEMAQRSIRRSLILISVEVRRGQHSSREERGRNPSWPGVPDSTKGRIHLRRPNHHPRFSLAVLRPTIHTDNAKYRSNAASFTEL